MTLIVPADPPIVDITPGLVNSWAVASGDFGFKVYQKGKLVWFEGVLDGASASAATACTLPAGSRPPTKIGFGGGWNKLWDVMTDGTLQVNSTGSAFCYVTGLMFRVA